MVTDTMEKRGRKYVYKREFDGKDGVPKMRLFLTLTGIWLDKFDTKHCLFPTKATCVGLYTFRCTYENKITSLREKIGQIWIRRRGEDLKEIWESL